MTLLAILMAFCGGAFGAIIGGLEAFIFTGLTGLVGIALAGSGGTFDWLGVISFGPVFAPWAAFAGGAAAAAYAKKINALNSGKDITTPLISLKKVSVLAVGGVFAVLGYFVQYFVGGVLPGQIDAGAFAVVTVAIVSKLLFTGELFGKVNEEDKKLGGRFSPLAKTAWVPYMITGMEKTFLAIVAGGLSSFMTYMMLQNELTAGVAPFIGFCISAISLIFLQFGAAVPVTHHITLCAGYAVAASGGNLYWGIGAAIIAAFAGDFLARAFYNYGDVHIDPPGFTIALISFLVLGILPKTGLYSVQAEMVVVPIVIIAAIYSVLEMNWIKKKQTD